MNNTLNGKYSKDHIVEFQQYKIIGTHYDRSLKAVVHGHRNHNDDYWEFIFSAAGSKNQSGQAETSICLNIEDITELKDDLYRKIKALDLSDVGKCEYYLLDIPDIDFEFCYSATELNEIISSIGKGLTLMEVLIPVESVFLPHTEDEDYLYLWSGGSVLLSFGNIAIELAIHAEALFEYRILYDFDKINMLKVYKRYGNEENGYYDAQLKFTSKIKGEKVVSLHTIGGGFIPFSIAEFDEEKVERVNDLPKAVVLNLENGNYLELIGDEIEYMSMSAGTNSI